MTLGLDPASLPAGDHGEVYELTPPVVITDEQIDYALDRVAAAISGDAP